MLRLWFPYNLSSVTLYYIIKKQQQKIKQTKQNLKKTNQKTPTKQTHSQGDNEQTVSVIEKIQTSAQSSFLDLIPLDLDNALTVTQINVKDFFPSFVQKGYTCAHGFKAIVLLSLLVGVRCNLICLILWHVLSGTRIYSVKLRFNPLMLCDRPFLVGIL